MEIKGTDYRVWNEPDAVVRFQGVLRLPGVEAYKDIAEFLARATADRPEVTLDVRELQFLNSAGINMMYKFAISLRDRNAKLIVRGANDVGWQSKSLRNLGRFVGAFELHFA